MTPRSLTQALDSEPTTVLNRTLLVSAALLAHIAGAQAHAVAGCYALTVGDWVPRIGGDSIYHRMPFSIVLDTTPKGPGFTMSPDIAYPRSNRFPTAPRWQVQGDTLMLIWSNGFAPTIVRLTSQGTEWVGDATAENDHHPIPEPPRPRAPVRVKRHPCAV